MRRVKTAQFNFNAGVVDARIVPREDLKYTYNGVAEGRNVVFMPQGGVTLRPGQATIDRARHVLEEIDLSGATVTAGAQVPGPLTLSGTVGVAPDEPDPYPDEDILGGFAL